MADIPRQRLRVRIPEQELELRGEAGRLLTTYPVSTAARGAGETSGSYRTPRGRHQIRARIGAGQPVGSVFVARRPTGEIWSPQLAGLFPERDWILTRILWLSGLEPGFNRLGEVDTMRRYVYIHGTPETTVLGVPGSHGCVRMDNRQLIELFDQVAPHTQVDIVDHVLVDGGWERLSAEAFALREAVFVREQGVPVEMELDEFDAVSRHVLARDREGRAVGTGRLLPDGHIGRLAVAREWRGRGVGRDLMDRLLDLARAEGRAEVALHAQVSALAFYQGFGFVAEGAVFDEAGIPHRLMRLRLA